MNPDVVCVSSSLEMKLCFRSTFVFQSILHTYFCDRSVWSRIVVLNTVDQFGLFRRGGDNALLKFKSKVIVQLPQCYLQLQFN